MTLIPAPFSIHIDARIARLDLGNPEQGNILSRAQMLQLAEAISALGINPEVSVVAIVARGEAFCLGRDGKNERREPLPWDARQKQMGAVLAVYNAIDASVIPVVSCVQGNAIGFGAALAGGCDITLASDAARFALPEINHSIPATLAISALIRKMPIKALSHMVYSAEEISAEMGVSLGLVSKVFPADSFASNSDDYLRTLADRPRLVLETLKRYFGKAPELSPAMASEYAGTLLALVRPSI